MQGQVLTGQGFELVHRAASLEDIVRILHSQHAMKLDAVAPARKIRSENGLIVIEGIEAHIDENGATPVDGAYLPTEIFDKTMADKLPIPLDYLRVMRRQRPDLVDANVNGWLHGSQQFGAARDRRSFLLRLFRGSDGGPGVARAMLSDHYKLTLDQLDVLMAVLDGVNMAGVTVNVTSCDLTEQNLRVRFEAPAVSMLAPDLLRDYRNPFAPGTGLRRVRTPGPLENEDGSKPVVWSGFDFRNNELGGGAYVLTPVVGVLECLNGLVLTRYGMRKAHIGAKLADGMVDISADTIRKARDLIAAETRDTVRTWLSTGYLETVVRQLEEQAGVPLTDAPATIQFVTGRLSFTQDESDAILRHFIAGAQATAGGVMQAVSSFAQTVADPDRAAKISSKAVTAMELAATTGQ